MTQFCKQTISSGNVKFDQSAFKDAWRSAWNESELERSHYLQVTLVQDGMERRVLEVSGESDSDIPEGLNEAAVDAAPFPTQSQGGLFEAQMVQRLVLFMQVRDPLALTYFSPVPMAGAIKLNRLLFEGSLSAPRLVVGLYEDPEEVGVRALLMHKAAVGTIFQKAADQIGKQIAMPANRRIYPAIIAVFTHHIFVQTFAHAVQTLEFKLVLRDIRFAGPIDNRGDGQRIMAGKCGFDIVIFQQVTGAGEV